MDHNVQHHHQVPNTRISTRNLSLRRGSKFCSKAFVSWIRTPAKEGRQEGRKQTASTASQRRRHLAKGETGFCEGGSQRGALARDDPKLPVQSRHRQPAFPGLLLPHRRRRGCWPPSPASCRCRLPTQSTARTPPLPFLVLTVTGFQASRRHGDLKAGTLRRRG